MSKTSGAGAASLRHLRAPVRDAQPSLMTPSLGVAHFSQCRRPTGAMSNVITLSGSKRYESVRNLLSATVPERSNYWGPLWGPFETRKWPAEIGRPFF